ncbi:DUF6984 family protein [Mesorhizobium sp. ASY16-5R]|uniref:DUF6984 family protein n=1 Tax=Mesorhizobium sp. ASY16-5R TaxID=3445772 RepID=UPI003F9F013F
MVHKLPLSDQALFAARQLILDYATAALSMDSTTAATFEGFDDGQMGSFKVFPSFKHCGLERLEGEWGYTDLDGAGVLITVFSRDGRRISSFDFWRYDFGALLAFPEPSDLILSPFLAERES